VKDGGDPQRLLELLAGKWVAQAVSTAARLGLADALSLTEPRSVEALSESLGCHPPSLRRLLEVLVGESLVAHARDGAFLLTSAGTSLQSDQLGALASYVGSRTQWDPWSALEHSVRTGQPAFSHVHGQGLFEHLAAHPEDGHLYDAAVDAFTRHTARALSEGFDFSGVRTLVDVGGGRGTLLVELLTRWPEMQGTLMELPHVARMASPRLADAVGARCTVWEGDFHERVPEGADAYVLKHVIHNWDDEDAAGILARCAEAMSPTGRVLVVEGILLPGTGRDATRLLDLEMLVLTGKGRERSKPEFRRLLARAGLRLLQTVPLEGSGRLMVAGRRA
jgi:hypothetical protein